jgi:cytochrome c oxidase assembly protein subunit 15
MTVQCHFQGKERVISMKQLCVDDDRRKVVGLWLLTLAAMVLVDVLLGGLTRLTGSGLSMVEWQPLTLLPPLNETAWQDMFASYQQSPQFRLVNDAMTLEGFKGIFWLEYVHRLWGRLLGFAFLLPFLYFFVSHRLTRREIPALLLLFLLGAAQGVLGWAMVASGLRDRPEVSHYRLAAHLFAGLLLYAALLWSGFTRLKAPERVASDNRSLRMARRHLPLLLGLLYLTIPAGALVAGLHAGLIYNSFPLMGDRLLASDAWDLIPAWLNFFANPAMVQFDHRVLALLTWLMAMSLLPAALRDSLPWPLRWKLALVPLLASVQFVLGVLTLLWVVPLPLAALHQFNAFLLFGAGLWSYVEVRRSAR